MRILTLLTCLLVSIGSLFLAYHHAVDHEFSSMLVCIGAVFLAVFFSLDTFTGRD